MKTIKLIMFLFVATSFNLSQGQAIVKKWDDLNDFSSILSKVNFSAKEENFDHISKYTPLMVEYSKKIIPDNMPKELRTINTDKELTKLGNYIKEFDALVQKNADKSELKNILYKLNESYTNFVMMVKID